MTLELGPVDRVFKVERKVQAQTEASTHRAVEVEWQGPRAAPPQRLGDS